ncbi:hypothetical protein MRQ36_17380 [Micromonospora sp. R77]|uniref:hypothetical protein n=1 Tax=Micromonospora sp. R77 TaxID=2925836 RepID=UPI001F605F39|nr:hypothetical protein [Micromonospora sp. R77]MCI4064270.1 hypothetical protein [Micromonospora sp. R77]
MSPSLVVVLVLLLGSTSYAAGRLHGQLSYRIGYRFGYRQGYFDGDRGAWNRRRRDAQAVIASALARPVAVPPSTTPVRGATGAVPLAGRAAAGPSARAGTAPQLGAVAARQGTTYTGSSFAAAGPHPTGMLVRRHG